MERANLVGWLFLAIPVVVIGLWVWLLKRSKRQEAVALDWDEGMDIELLSVEKKAGLLTRDEWLFYQQLKTRLGDGGVLLPKAPLQELISLCSDTELELRYWRRLQQEKVDFVCYQPDFSELICCFLVEQPGEQEKQDQIEKLFFQANIPLFRFSQNPTEREATMLRLQIWFAKQKSISDKTSDII